MKTLTSLIYISVLTLLSTTQVIAHNAEKVQVFYSYESSGDDYITGVGTGFSVLNQDNNFGIQLTTSLSNAEVVATDGYIEDYVAWEGGVKLGFFSNVSIYAEAGVDLTELFFRKLRYDDLDFYIDEYEDQVDSYVGVGVGINAGDLSISAFSRARNIDSKYWEAESEVFTGVQFSISF